MDTLLEKATPTRLWAALYDDYDSGSMFITDDPTGMQTPLVEDLQAGEALRLVEEHNRSVNAYEPLVKALAVARFVAEHWRDAYMENVRRGESQYGIGTHPLSLVLAALDGETSSRELGLPASAEAGLRAALATVESPEREK